jgi:Xaa-Pro dipeptidase
MDIERLQKALRQQGVDGWLFYDFRVSNPIPYRVLGLSSAQTFTRRWFYWLPAQGEPGALVSALEAHNLDALPGRKVVYRDRQEMAEGLAELLKGQSTVAMEYSPMAEIPVVSRVDAGTVELVRSLGTNVVSSADMVQAFESPLSAAAYDSHIEAERRLAAIMKDTLGYLRREMLAGNSLNEYDVRRFMLGRYEEYDLFLDHGPTVAVGPNASNPHYEPTAEVHAPIRWGDLLLIDWWGKLPTPGSVYADYTWMIAVDDHVQDRHREVFDVVRAARDAAIEFIRTNIQAGNPVQGWQVDDVARAYITERGYGDYFVHRTGHSIGPDIHGSGANMDNFETHDTRLLLPRTLFSIEPGIYLPEFGVRCEVNVYVGEGTIEVTGRPVQQELPALFS